MALFWKQKENDKVENKQPTAATGLAQEDGVDPIVEAVDSTKHHNETYLQIKQEFERGGEGVVMLLYLNNFKQMNNLFGYEACEQLIRDIMDCLETYSGCKVIRHIGVQFVMILHDYSMSQATKLAEKICDRFNHGWQIRDFNCLREINIGMCLYPGYSCTPEEMIKYLDLAVTQAIDQGENEYSIFDKKMYEGHIRNQKIAQYINTALTNDEVEIRFRPTYDVSRGKFVRAEFHMNMFIQDVGMVNYQELIPIAEDSGQIRTMEYYALEKVAAMIAHLISQNIEFESIAIQAAPVLLLQENFADEVSRLLEKYEIPKGKMAIEISEHTLASSYMKTVIVMQELEELGVELILNNFGSGYSGLTTLLELPVDTLKFNKMFIWQVETNPACDPIVEGLIQIAHKMNKRLVAEGVETKRQLEVLDQFDCELRQGYYYSPTVSPESLLEILDKSVEEAQDIINAEREYTKK